LQERDRVRLAFSVDSSQIEHGLSELVMIALDLFREIYRTQSWPGNGDGHADHLFQRGTELVRQWEHLNPPRPLRPLWRELDGQIIVLVSLLREVGTMRAFAGTRGLPERVHALQQRFNTHLGLMNSLEGRLLDAEDRLRAVARGTDDRVNRDA